MYTGVRVFYPNDTLTACTALSFSNINNSNDSIHIFLCSVILECYRFIEASRHIAGNTRLEIEEIQRKHNQVLKEPAD